MTSSSIAEERKEGGRNEQNESTRKKKKRTRREKKIIREKKKKIQSFVSLLFLSFLFSFVLFFSSFFLLLFLVLPVGLAIIVIMIVGLVMYLLWRKKRVRALWRHDDTPTTAEPVASLTTLRCAKREKLEDFSLLLLASSCYLFLLPLLHLVASHCSFFLYLHSQSILFFPFLDILLLFLSTFFSPPLFPSL